MLHAAPIAWVLRVHRDGSMHARCRPALHALTAPAIGNFAGAMNTAMPLQSLFITVTWFTTATQRIPGDPWTAPQMTIYVRPCAIGEFLTPTLDQCINCSSGYYNFDKAAHICHACPRGALCSDESAPGMVVPGDGYWHANAYSEQVGGWGLMGSRWDLMGSRWGLMGSRWGLMGSRWDLMGSRGAIDVPCNVHAVICCRSRRPVRTAQPCHGRLCACTDARTRGKRAAAKPRLGLTARGS